MDRIAPRGWRQQRSTRHETHEVVRELTLPAEVIEMMRSMEEKARRVDVLEAKVAALLEAIQTAGAK